MPVRSLPPPSHWLAPAVTCLLLAGLTLDRRLWHQPAPGASAYHQRVRLAVAALPYQIGGDWAGVDVPPLPAVIELLRPNVLLERRFTNSRTGEVASVLLVQCQDARDLGGHYPPICYPANGWTQGAADTRTWQVADRPLPGMEYRFRRQRGGAVDELVVASLLLLPDGTLARDIAAVRRAAADRRRRGFGAGQVQVVTESRLPDARRRQIVETLLGGLQPVLDAVCPPLPLGEGRGEGA